MLQLKQFNSNDYIKPGMVMLSSQIVPTELMDAASCCLTIRSFTLPDGMPATLMVNGLPIERTKNTCFYYIQMKLCILNVYEKFQNKLQQLEKGNNLGQACLRI